MSKELNEQELRDLIQKCDKDIELNNKKAEELYNLNDSIYDKKFEYEKQLNEIIYKDFKLDTKSCYHITNESYGYHGIKERVIYVNSVSNNNEVKYTEYIIKDDDGDEIFYIAKRTTNKYNLIDNLIKDKAETISILSAQFIVNKWVIIQQVEG